MDAVRVQRGRWVESNEALQNKNYIWIDTWHWTCNIILIVLYNNWWYPYYTERVTVPVQQETGVRKTVTKSAMNVSKLVAKDELKKASNTTAIHTWKGLLLR